jgi:hypothetical protein
MVENLCINFENLICFRNNRKPKCSTMNNFGKKYVKKNQKSSGMKICGADERLSRYLFCKPDKTNLIRKLPANMTPLGVVMAVSFPYVTDATSRATTRGRVEAANYPRTATTIKAFFLHGNTAPRSASWWCGVVVVVALLGSGDHKEEKMH